MALELFTIVRTTKDFPEYGLIKGDRGAILEIYGDGEGYDVEFPATTDPTHVVVMHPADIEAVPSRQPAVA
ncbi:MAG TPA: DUF4926 domain-containing protein [Armatimonadota bacterium]